jgi:hypothetical protein
MEAPFRTPKLFKPTRVLDREAGATGTPARCYVELGSG